MQCTFITGGTGLLGVNIVKELLQHTSGKIVLLMRKVTVEKRTGLFRDLLAFNGDQPLDLLSLQRIEFVEGDVTLPRFGLKPTRWDRLVKEVDMVYHSAAVITLSGAEHETYSVNVQGTKNVLDFALACRERGVLDRVVHVSTVAVSGNRQGTVLEDELDNGQVFNNPYEKSKFEAEKLVMKYRSIGLPVTVVRPSMVIGSSRTGFTNNFNIFYFQLRLLSQGVFDTVPITEGAVFNFVPADLAARAICLISGSRESVNNNHHIVNDHSIPVRNFFEKVSAYLGYKKPHFVSPADISPAALAGVRGKILSIYYPYVTARKAFDSSRARQILESRGFVWPAMNDASLTKMLDYCIYSGYTTLGSEVGHETGAYNA
ncbi:MAG TPA: SDR family oxidoreductase [Nitrospirota bacterium]|nr:SDR family oxidoreductase [Nitrospirota bacterium]